MDPAEEITNLLLNTDMVGGSSSSNSSNSGMDIDSHNGIQELSNNSNNYNQSPSHSNTSGMVVEDLWLQIKEKKIQFLLNRDPSNSLIVEGVDKEESEQLKQIVEDYLEQSTLPPFIFYRYISILKSIMIVFIHRNDCNHVKLLIERQPFIDVKHFKIYFGKEISEHIIRKHQLCPPFATRQYLISPPLSPPDEWQAPGDGLEHSPPTEQDDSHFSGFDPERLTEKLQVIYQDKTSNGFPSITLEFCT